MRLEFDVHGKPAGMGSKKAFFVKKLGRAVITDDNKPAKKNWENAVATAAAEAMAGRELITGPVWVHFIFWFARPKAHFRTGKNSHLLSDSAPAFHISKPDFDKLCRLMADAMTGVVYRDDSQICSAVLEKQWTTGSEGARVIVESEGLNVRMPGNREGVVPVKVARPAGSGGGDAEAEREQGVDLPV